MNEPIEFELTIKAGADYAIDFSYEEDDGATVDVTGWQVESQLRGFPEAFDAHDFESSADSEGFHLRMNHEETSKISFTRGAYDVFITAPDNSVRDKLIYGRARIIPEVSR